MKPQLIPRTTTTPPKPIYVALFSDHLGKGASPTSAIRDARIAGARGRRYRIFRMPAGTTKVRLERLSGCMIFDGAPDDAFPELVVDHSKPKP